MAVGGYHVKGNSGGGPRERGRPYGMMLLLAFGAAIIGVMALHKARERRNHSLVLKDKDREIFSLQLLLQKERDYTKEMAKKAEEMRAKIYNLRTQKMELSGRVLEMQSTISSLKDEQRTVQLALEEKRDEIKMLREKEMDKGKRDLEESSLKETLNEKETEIAELQRQLGNLKVSTTENGTHELEKEEEKGILHESSENSNGTRRAEETERKLDVSATTMLAEKEDLKVQGNVTEEGSAGFRGEQNSAGKGERSGMNAISRANVGGIEDSAVESRKLEERGKPEQLGDSSGHSGSTIQRKLGDGNRSRSRGKKWRALARNRRLESKNNSAAMKHRRFIEDAVEIIERKQLGDNAANEEDQGMNTEKTNESDQISSVVKVSRDFNGDGHERREDGHGYEIRGEGEESRKEDKEHETVSKPRDHDHEREDDRHGYQSRGEGRESPKEDNGDETVSNLRDQSNGEAPIVKELEVESGKVGRRDGDAGAEDFSKDTEGGEAGTAEEEAPAIDPKEETRGPDRKDSREPKMERADSDFSNGDAEVEEHTEEDKEESEF